MSEICLGKTHYAYTTCNLDLHSLSLQGWPQDPRAVEEAAGGSGLLGMHAKGAPACKVRPERPL